MSQLSYGLEGKVALVTGGTRGIGHEVARRLAEEKAKVIICARNTEGLETTANILEITGVSAHIGKEEQVDSLFEVIKGQYGRLDILVNNVGMNLLTPPLDQVEPQMFRKIIDTNLTGTFLVARRAAAMMRDQGGGKIVTVSSIAAHKAAPAMTIYGIAKSAMEMMTKVLAAELAGDNIQVNAVAPGMVKTGFSEPFWSDEATHDRLVAQIPAGRLAEVRDIAEPILFLASAGADYITGQTIMIDGGAGVV